MDIETDHGTVLPAGSSALVVDENGELNFFMTEGWENEEVPMMVQLLAAVLIRSEDDKWVAETVATLDDLDPN
jgi:hypothetical protein